MNGNKEKAIALMKRFCLSGNIGKKALFHNGVEYVDLGLPSGLKWAKMNIGANTDSDVGLYFQWGDVHGYTSDDVHNGNKHFNLQDYRFNENGLCTKYTVVDGKYVLDSEDDAARFGLGGFWRMPTKEEFDELLNYTNHRQMSLNNVKGTKFINKKTNRKWIFLPFSGYVNNGCCEDVGNYGDYWTSTAAPSDGIRDTSSFYIGVGVSNEYWASYCSRRYGFAIRPVFQESEANR